MSEKILSPGAPPPTAQISPLPVTVQGGALRILEGAPVPAVWSGPWGYYPDNVKQVTSDAVTISSVTATADAGATASDVARLAGEWSVANKAAFLAGFVGARPGLLYGIVMVSRGNGWSWIDDMYNASETSSKVYRPREDWAYESGSFSMKKIFEPRTPAAGMWNITFPKPIPFHLGLRISQDNGNISIYFLYSLDPAFA